MYTLRVWSFRHWHEVRCWLPVCLASGVLVLKSVFSIAFSRSGFVLPFICYHSVLDMVQWSVWSWLGV